MKITIKGYGGHGAHPDRTVDPVLTADALIMSLQTIVSRNVMPNETAIVTVDTIHAGIASNIIPESAMIELTVRAMKPEVRKLLLLRIRETAELTA